MQYWDQEDVPNDIQRLMNTWSLNNSTFAYKLFNKKSAESFIETHYGNKLAALFSTFLIPAMQSDFFRVAYLLKKGGIYVDSSSECYTNILPIVRNEPKVILMRKWHGKLCNRLIVSPPGSPFLQKIWDELKHNTQDNDTLKSKDVWSITGPKVFIDTYNNGFSDYVKVIEQSELSSIFKWVNNTEHKKKAHWSIAQTNLDSLVKREPLHLDKELIIHLGQHKTGSTAIQRCAMEYRGDSFSYPDAGRLYAGHHSLPNILLKSGEEEFELFLHKFLQEVKSNKSKYVLLSSEFLSANTELYFNKCDMEVIWKRLAFIASFFTKSKVVYYIREQSLAIESRINQAIKSRICYEKLDLETLLKNEALDYYGYNNLLTQIFDRSEVIPLAYERSNFINNDICADFFKRFMSLDVEYGSSNPRIHSLNTVLLCLKINGLPATTDVKMVLKDAVIRTSTNPNTANPTSFILTKGQVEIIRKAYENGNSELLRSSKYFTGFKSYLKSNHELEIKEMMISDELFYDAIAKIISSKPK